MTAQEIKRLLSLDQHPVEGGFFRRTYTSSGTLELPRGTRHQGTAIYYLLDQDHFSEMHVLDSDELFHFYLGDPVEMLKLFPDGTSVVTTLGQNIAARQELQVLVPAGVWQGMRLIDGGDYALLGCTVVPGFNYADYHNATFAELARKWPDQTERIRLLTRT